MANPYLTGWLYVPHRLISDPAALRAQLTVHPKAWKDEVKEPIPMYDEGVPGYLGIPPKFGFDMLPESVEIEDRTSLGHPITVPKRPDPYHPQAAEGQDRFMDELAAALRDEYTVLAKADTGTGKTVAALDMMAELQCTTIVCVHLKRLAKQWKDEAMLHLGLTEDEIGIVQGPKCQYEGKKLVIAMMPSLAKRKYDDAFYDYFGYAIWDEVHRCGAPTCRKTLGQFSAAAKLSLTATVKRSDRCERVYLLYFGEPRVVSNQKAVHTDVRFIRYRTRSTMWGENHGTRVQCISRDRRRNKMLRHYILEMYNEGRDVLGLGDGVAHIETIAQMLRDSGVPDNHIGLFTDKYTAEDGSSKKSSDEYLDWCLKAPRIILATYGMMKEGISCARLSGGIELTPRSDIIQTMGRVRRKLPGKTNAVWYSPVDVAVGSFLGYAKKREKEAREDPATAVTFTDA